jgi:hypothetical protein
MRQIHIEKKPWDLLRNAPDALHSLQSQEVEGTWITVDVLSQSGLPLAMREALLLHLASRLGAQVESTTNAPFLRFKFEDLSRAPWTLRLPSKLQGLAHRIWRISTRIGVMAAGVGTSFALWLLTVFYLVILVNIVPSPAPIWAKAVAGLLLLLNFFVSVPMGAVLLVAIVPIALVVALFTGSFLTFVTFLPAAVVVLGAAYVFYDLFERWAFGMVRFFRNFLNFGVERVGRLWDEQLFLQLVVAKKGRISIGDLMVLYGWTRQQAFEELTQLMLDYGGEVEVQEHGSMVFDFSAALPEAQIKGLPLPVWERERRPSEVFDTNARRADWGLMGFWVVGLLIPFLGALWALPHVGAGLWGISGLLTLIPLFVFIRRLVVARRDANYRSRAEFLARLKQVSNSGGFVKAAVEDFDTKTLIELGGDLDESTSGEAVVFHFPEYVEDVEPEASVVHPTRWWMTQ